MQKILFISHDASRTGAPILLLNLVKLLLTFNEYEVNFLLKKGGDLENEFKNLAPTYFLYQQKRTKFNYLKSKLFKTKSLLEDKKFLNQYHHIISNTITNGDILEKIRNNYKNKIISYIHELEVASKTYTTSKAIDIVIKSSDKFWVPSSLVKEFLYKEFNILENNIFKMPYFIENRNILPFDDGENKNNFIIGGCGTIDWRKGPDLFLQVANELFLKRPNASIVFKWKGANNGVELMRLQCQIKMTNLDGKIFFESSSDKLDSFYNEIDLFLLTSREDPYPLVILEAAQFAKPSICFDKVCGSSDFINNSNGGEIIPFLDISATANAILKFYDNSIYTTEKGQNAKQFLLKTHSNKQYVYNEFKKALL
ncbi:glycosyltransferase family 4 protein [Flavobacterium sp. MDT1-60]|uniref:glycosyltransferase family 4 protein n=1 Tax=Flavobacterium sp. MDT1-60 TaxID=1979344 RepID=UPI00177B6345|nr:glycosyltransferase family 4 protein [Flavobacterium sp. MDT1-60]QOG03805.1 glycosyltransferase family 4 protein [Flavobacterium sp. MDT1-60]